MSKPTTPAPPLVRQRRRYHFASTLKSQEAKVLDIQVQQLHETVKTIGELSGLVGCDVQDVPSKISDFKIVKLDMTQEPAKDRKRAFEVKGVYKRISRHVDTTPLASMCSFLEETALSIRSRRDEDERRSEQQHLEFLELYAKVAGTSGGSHS